MVKDNPHEETLQIVLEIWETQFPHAAITPNSNFFMLGGDSLAAASMTMDVELRTGLQIPAGTIFEAPTAGRFAERILQCPTNPRQPILIPLRSAGRRHPLFAVAPVTGGVFHYRQLWEHLSEEQPCYCIEPRISSTGQHVYQSVSELAQECIEVMRSVQPCGPYRLTGFSFGGVIAWEMARILKKSGEEIAALIMLDTLAQGRESTDYISGDLYAQIRHHLNNWSTQRRNRMEYGAKLDWHGIAGVISFRLKYHTRRALKRFLPDPDRRFQPRVHFNDPDDPRAIALRKSYAFENYEGPLYLLRGKTQRRLIRLLDYTLGWHGKARELHIVEIPGHHHAMLREPFVEHTALEITRILAANEPARKPATETSSPISSIERIPFPIEEIGDIRSRFQKIVDAFPDRPAIYEDGRILTYGELDARANQCANAIIDRIGSQKQPVVLYEKNGAEFIAMRLAVVRSGNYYVPLDPDLPAERVAIILEDAQPALILSSFRFQEQLKGATCECEAPTLYCEEADSYARSPLNVDTSPDDWMIVMYTSGSTGKPKGVVHSQRSVMHIMWRRIHGIDFYPTDRCAYLYSGAYMGAMTGTYAPLLSGACLYPFDPKEKGIENLPDFMQRHKITNLHCVTSLYRRFVVAIRPGTKWPHLRSVVPGGEPSRPSDIEEFRRTFPRTTVYLGNLGSTECGSIAFHPITHDCVIEGPIPSGRAFPTLAIYTVDEEGNRLPDGEEGEVAIEGERIFEGYLHQPEQTAKVLNKTDRGTWVFRTGDFGYIGADGVLYTLGRKDGMVKIMGYRVEIGDVESAIQSIPGIDEVVVVVYENSKGENRLHAYYRSEKGALDGDALRGALKGKLPAPMIPKGYTRLETLPLLPNGKIARKHLASQLTQAEG